MTARDLRNLRRLNLWLFVMMALLMLSLFAIRRDAFGAGVWTTAMAVLPAAAFIGVYRSVRAFLSQADELTQRIQVQAMAAGGAGAFVAWMVQSLGEAVLALVSAPVWAAETVEVLSPMMGLAIGYVAAVLTLQRRYGG